MLYVLTLGWVWFAAAGALGLLVGFATATRGRGGEFSGWWVILAAFGVLAGGFAGAELGLVPGRAGLQLEIGLLAALAYFIGLPIGGGAKSLLPAPAAAPMKPTPVVVRGRPRDEEPPAPIRPAPKLPRPQAARPRPRAAARRERDRRRRAGIGGEGVAREKALSRPASRKPRGAARRNGRRSDQDQGHWTQKRREAACARRVSLRSDRRLEHRQRALDWRGARPFPAGSSAENGFSRRASLSPPRSRRDEALEPERRGHAGAGLRPRRSLRRPSRRTCCAASI